MLSLLAHEPYQDAFMEQTVRTLGTTKHIALVAHDHCKAALLDWVKQNQPALESHILYATGTTGNLINRDTGLNVTAMLSGPMGGDQQVGALISEGKIDALIFSGIHSTQCRTIRMSKHCCVWLPYGISR